LNGFLFFQKSEKCERKEEKNQLRSHFCFPKIKTSKKFRKNITKQINYSMGILNVLVYYHKGIEIQYGT